MAHIKHKALMSQVGSFSIRSMKDYIYCVKSVLYAHDLMQPNFCVYTDVAVQV